MSHRGHGSIWSASLMAGALAGLSGVGIGSAVAILRPSPRIGFYAFGTGLNCFVLGTTYWALREWLLRTFVTGSQPEAARERLLISSVAGASTGATGGYFIGGRPSIVPGALVFGLAGLWGQLGYQLLNTYNLRQSVEAGCSPQDGQEKGQGYLGRLLNSESSPIRRLSVHEYNSIMQSKILAIEADIALVSEEICRFEDKKSRTKGED